MKTRALILKNKLFQALKENSTESVIHFLNEVKNIKLDLNSLFDHMQWKPIHWASYHGNIVIANEIFKLFGKAENIDLQLNDSLYTPLHISVERGCDEFALKLIEQEAKINIFNIHGLTSLHIAIKKSNFEFLVNTSFNFNQLTEDMVPILIFAIKEKVDIGKFLQILPENFDFCLSDKNGFNALHFIAKYSDSELWIDFLVNKGIDINQHSSFNGYTPLMVAIENNNLPAIAGLIKNGAKPYLKNYEGKDALELAANVSNNLKQFISDKFIEYSKLSNNFKTFATTSQCRIL